MTVAMTAGRPGRVLIADRRRLHGLALDAALRAASDVTVVGRVDDASAAITAAEALDADIVILDAELPTTGGVEACSRIKHAGAARVVVLVDDAPRPDTLLEAVQADADGYVTREASFATFMAAVRSAARGEISVPRHMQPALLRGLRDDMRARERTSVLVGRLTRREREVAELLADGLNHHAVAEVLSISPQTVRTHIQNALTKLEVGSRLAAAAMLRRHRRNTGGGA